MLQEQCPWFPKKRDLDTWVKLGKQLKTYYIVPESEKVPVDAFAC